MQEMNNDRKEGMLDDLLDGALAEYSNVEPRAGLESRIVAGLSSSDQRSWIWNWKWAVAFAAACLLVVFGLMSLRTRPAQVIVKKAPEVNSQATIGKAVVPDKQVAKPRVRRVVSASKQHQTGTREVAVMKKPTFPAAAPLSEQERLLFAYLRKTPREELVKNSKPDEPKLELEMNQVVPGMVRDMDRNTNLR